MFLGRYGIMTRPLALCQPGQCTTFASRTVQRMDGAPIEFLPAHELAHLMRSGQISALDVVGAHLDRIAEVNPMLNAVVALDVDAALASARERGLP